MVRDMPTARSQMSINSCSRDEIKSPTRIIGLDPLTHLLSIFVSVSATLSQTRRIDIGDGLVIAARKTRGRGWVSSNSTGDSYRKKPGINAKMINE